MCVEIVRADGLHRTRLTDAHPKDWGSAVNFALSITEHAPPSPSENLSSLAVEPVQSSPSEGQRALILARRGILTGVKIPVDGRHLPKKEALWLL